MILSIAPRLPPAACGVGAYSYRLSQSWPTPEHFAHLVVEGASSSRESLSEPNIVDVGRSSANLLRELSIRQPSLVILHYSSRGFHPYGTPFWLSSAMEQWKKNEPQADLIVMFHEVPSPLPLRTHHGVIDRMNQYIIGRLCKYSSIVLTNTSEHASRLKKICAFKDVHCVPNPSNIMPAHGCMASFKQRNPTDFLIFGLPFTQLLTITAFAQELVSWSSKRLLKRLHLVGPPSLEANRLLRSMLPIDAIVQHGVLLDWELSSLLEKTGFCLTQSTENNYAKSGTFMAFASHGCPTIGKVSKNAPPFSFLVHPAEIGHYHYTELAQRAVALRNWYFSEHDWPIVTTKIAALISQSRIKS